MDERITGSLADEIMKLLEQLHQTEAGSPEYDKIANELSNLYRLGLDTQKNYAECEKIFAECEDLKQRSNEENKFRWINFGERLVECVLPLWVGKRLYMHAVDYSKTDFIDPLAQKILQFMTPRFMKK